MREEEFVRKHMSPPKVVEPRQRLLAPAALEVQGVRLVFRGGHTGEWHFLGSAGQMIDCGVISCRWILSRQNSLIAKKKIETDAALARQQRSRFRSSLEGTSRPGFCR
jgi:hypothetical protein